MLRMRRAGPITIASIRGRARGGGSGVRALVRPAVSPASRTRSWGNPRSVSASCPAGGAIERLPGLVGSRGALEIIASSDDYDAVTAERYGWINRAIPTAN